MEQTSTLTSGNVEKMGCDVMGSGRGKGGREGGEQCMEQTSTLTSSKVEDTGCGVIRRRVSRMGETEGIEPNASNAHDSWYK